MAYYIAKVNIETGEIKRNGDPVVHVSQFLVPAETIIEVEKKVAEYMVGSVSTYETVQISVSKIEAVLD
jgi:hypothetical protein